MFSSTSRATSSTIGRSFSTSYRNIVTLKHADTLDLFKLRSLSRTSSRIILASNASFNSSNKSSVITSQKFNLHHCRFFSTSNESEDGKANNNSKESETNNDSTTFATLSSRFHAFCSRPDPSEDLPPRSLPAIREWVYKCLLFAITGSSSVALVRPLLKKYLGLEGSLKDGPNSYRVLSIILVSPVYTLILLTVGTLGGRHQFFARIAIRMWGRLVPRWILERYAVCGPAQASSRLGGMWEKLQKGLKKSGS